MKWISCIATLLTLVATSANIEAAVFSNPTGINLPASGTTATPFPSTINVSGMVGTITKVTVTLNFINHPRPDDLEILLVGPTGKKFILLADAGGTGTAATGVTITFDDAAASLIADAGPMTPGTFKPTCVDAQANINTEFPGVVGPFDVPAPSGSGTLGLSFNGTIPNGNWNLYVVDDIEGTPSGSIDGGWSLNITTGSTTEPSTTRVISSANPSKVGSNVTFTATVQRTNSSPVTTGGVIFKEGATVLQVSNAVNGAGQVSFTTSALTEGIHIITAEYTGNASFFGSSGTITQVVDNATVVSLNTFANRGAITVGDTANVYPSHIFVTNLSGTISKVTMMLSNVTYARPDDLELLLVSPSGAQFIVLADAGGTASGMTSVTLNFDDGAAAVIPDNSPPGTGSYRPTDYNSTAAAFPPPAPSGPYNHPAPGGGSTFSNVFNGANPNGTWSLYVVDDVAGTGGTIAGGWALTFLLSSDAPTITTVTSSPNSSLTGDSVTFTAAVQRTSNSVAVTNGTVTFREGAVVLAAGVPLNTNGLASFATSVLTEGNHVISADYNGLPGFFNVSSGSTTQRVDNTTVISGNRFANPGPLFVPASDNLATVYPSRIIVKGLPPAICGLSVTLSNIYTDRPDDLEFLLVSPTGAQLVLMSDAGGVGSPAAGVSLILSDAAATMIASNGPLISGFFKPISVNSTAANFPAPAPAPPYNHPAPFGSATLNGTFTGNPNGYWSLYMVDDVPGALAAVSNGWSLTFNVAPVATVGGPQSICTGGTTAGLGGNPPLSGTGVWSVVSGGTGTFSPNAATPNATFTHVSGAGPITLRWTLTDPGCGSSFADVQVTIPCVPTLAGRVAIFGAPGDTNWNTDVRAKIMAAGTFQQVDMFSVRSGTPVPTLATLLQYQAVLVYSDAGFNDNTNLGNTLADYVDAGGGVVVATFAFWQTSGGDLSMQGRLLTGNYLPFTTGGQDSIGNLTLVKDLPSHPILNAVSSFNGGTGGYHNTPIAIANGAALIAHWNNGQPLIAARQSPTGGRVVGLNFYPPSSTAFTSGWLAGTDGGRIMANALSWAGAPAIFSGPSNTTAYVGTPVTFNVVAGGNPRDYQWRKNGAPIAGATGSSLNFIATLANAGQYSVIVSNVLGATVSSNATLTVLPPVQYTVNVLDTGWYNNSGVHNPDNSNYLSGNVSVFYRNFFVFNIPALPGPLSRAELRVNTYNIVSPTGSETYQLRHVSTPVPVLRAGGTNVATYNDLGDGPTYGTHTFSTNETNRFLTFPLNQSLRSAVSAAAGGTFAMGGEIISLDANAATSEYVFGVSLGAPGDVQLLLTVGGAPTVGYFTDASPASTGPAGPITAAGFNPLQITDIATQNLSGLRMLMIDESDNFAASAALVARLPDIANWVKAGGRLIIHDRSSGNGTNRFLFGVNGLTTVRSTGDDVSVVIPATTTLTAGPFGVVDDATVDGGCSSVHGFVYRTNMPPSARALLSTGASSNEVVALSFQWGAGFVYYSTIPLDYYLDGGDCASSITTNLQQIYTPNVLAYMDKINTPVEFVGPSVNATNGLPLFLRNADNSALSADRAAQIKVYSATNIVSSLTNWTLLSNPKVLTNGLLRIDGIRATNKTPTFYRAVETP